MKIPRYAWMLCAVFGLLGTARADDGGLSYGGLPHLLQGHPSVSMQSEVVRMRVGREVVKVECRFVFRNSGSACRVRMGFPDRGEGDADLGRRDESKPPTGTFLSYTSYVNGHVVPTRTLRSADPSQVWHVKDVSFPAGATYIVRDVYTVPTGGQGTGSGVYLQADYILYTGASWRGPIGKATVLVTFAPDAVPGAASLRPVSLRALPPHALETFPWGKRSRSTVLWDGPARPTVHGRTLQFVRSHWEPSAKDDVFLAFGYRTSAEVSRQ